MLKLLSSALDDHAANVICVVVGWQETIVCLLAEEQVCNTCCVVSIAMDKMCLCIPR